MVAVNTGSLTRAVVLDVVWAASLDEMKTIMNVSTY